jgi:hypothetical protein
LAPGWYGLLALFIGLVLFVVYFLKKHLAYARPKKEALALLKTLKEDYKTQNDSQVISAQISDLLRRVALVYFPREEVASLHGEDWLVFLNKTAKDINFNPVQSLLLDAPFKPAQNLDLNPLIIKAELWIKQRRVPCSN